MEIPEGTENFLSEEAALQTSSLKRLSDEAAKSPQNEEIKEEIKVLNDDIKAKNDQIATLEKQILDFVMASHEALDKSDIMQAVAELKDQLNENLWNFEVIELFLPSMALKREVRMSKERELSYEAALVEKDQREDELERILEEMKQRAAYMENALANMWVLVSKLRRSQGAYSEISDSISETRQTERSF
ncbi:hypothetical protein ISN44_As08g012670 [Arabidopsis suecica]|uniref:Uncharacterized protein n=1 Tax=Arabidopsis suecica TaxID=45249 RepID=A0A8T2B8T7_ARASU|nr:hypothetical protein ISN44_As08g012670 [Arabidopsis suecica]